MDGLVKVFEGYRRRLRRGQKLDWRLLLAVMVALFLAICAMLFLPLYLHSLLLQMDELLDWLDRLVTGASVILTTG